MQGQMGEGGGRECRCSQSLPVYRKCLLEDTGRLWEEGGGDLTDIYLYVR